MPDPRQLKQRRNRRHADRVRAAICIVLHDARTPLSLTELVTGVASLGVPLGAKPRKTVSDAVRWEILREHVYREKRGLYVVADLPPSTLRYMRVRVALYVADPTQSYSRPDNGPRVYADPPPVPFVDPNQLRLFI